MIPLTRLNGNGIILNALLIESIEETPDTIITLTSGKKLTVREPSVEVIGLVTTYLGNIGLIKATHHSADTEGS